MHHHPPHPSKLPHAPVNQPAPCCCGTACHDVPARPDRDDAPPPPTARTDTFRIDAMDCPMEEALIRKALGDLPGVAALRFDLLARQLTVHHDLSDTDAITTAIARLGMEAVPVAPNRPTSQAPRPVGAWITPLQAVALALAIFAETTSWVRLPPLPAPLTPWTPWVGPACALIALLACGLPMYRKGLIALAHGQFNINALMSLAATGALILRQYPEAAMVTVLFAIAERLESASLTHARNAVHALLALAPDTATIRLADGSFTTLPAEAVTVGATVRLRPGERIPLDGLVREGHSAVDQSPITGESLPVDKGPGDSLFAGTINTHGELLMATTALAGDSTLARITRTVTAAAGKKAPIERFVNRFAAVYTPAVLLVALGVALVPPLALGQPFTGWIYKGLVLLIIACPCALVISTPVTIVSGLAAAARRGLLIKGGLFLEQGHAIRTVVLDKTGTMTNGRPAQTAMEHVAGDPVRNRQCAAALAARSDHPVSRAVAEAATRDGLALPDVSDFAALPGLGVHGSVGGQTYHLVNHRRIEELGLCSPELEHRLEALEASGQTTVILADATRVLAVFGVADTVREHSRQAVTDLHRLGVDTLLLSGDSPRAAQAMARQLGIDQARGGLLPQDKADAVDALRAQTGPRELVAMVGDGINDAPALARADIGLAMAAAGSDAAIETADVAIMDDDPRKIPDFIRLSRATRTLLHQNIALALGLKGLVLALTVVGYGSMLLAVFADMGTSLLVIGNGLRLLRWRRG